MNRRHIVTLLASATAAWPPTARAQQGDARARALLARILQLRADGTAAAIGQFLNEIVAQVGWTTQLPWTVGTMEQRRFDALRLLRQVPAVTEIAFLDGSGAEQLKVSRLAMDVVASKQDLSQELIFKEAVAHKVYFGPVYLRRQSEPYLTLSLAGTRRESGVSVAMVGLKLVWDLIWELKIGEHGTAYILDSQDRVVAHSAMFTPPLDGERASYHVDLSLFQRDLSGLPQVQAARAAGAGPMRMLAGRDLNGGDVLSAASASIAGPSWRVFVDLPVAEADTAVP